MSDVLIDSKQVHALMAHSAIAIFKQKLEGYQSPLEPLIKEAFDANASVIRQAIHKATSECVNSPEFAKSLVAALNHKLANLVINTCSGLVEKSFSQLMQDQVLRTKLQAAVIQIVEGK